ncbi:MAG: hypothetical protein V5A36_04105 [Natronomonas sp.]|jgi:hypothetical protein
MTRNEIAPMVPMMPRTDTTDEVRADGGPRKRYDSDEVEAPIVPDLR